MCLIIYQTGKKKFKENNQNEKEEHFSWSVLAVDIDSPQSNNFSSHKKPNRNNSPVIIN